MSLRRSSTFYPMCHLSWPICWVLCQIQWDLDQIQRDLTSIHWKWDLELWNSMIISIKMPSNTHIYSINKPWVQMLWNKSNKCIMDGGRLGQCPPPPPPPPPPSFFLFFFLNMNVCVYITTNLQFCSIKLLWTKLPFALFGQIN